MGRGPTAKLRYCECDSFYFSYSVPPVPIWFIINTDGAANQACQSLSAFNVDQNIVAGTNVIPDDSADNGDMVVAVFAEVTMTPSDSPQINVNPSIALLSILDDDFG